MTNSDQKHFDVLIVGAGLSGIGAAIHLQKNCPNKRFAILEARERLGGTWDLFRYPGIRSDSDMFTLGYAFKPWQNADAIAEGGDILAYLEEAAAESGVDRNIRLSHRVVAASWDSQSARWTLQIRTGDNAVELTCAMLWMCSGYYRYEAGYTPDFEAREDFEGEIIHPQHWPENFDYAGKKIVVIGSGATAITLVPALADRAAHVTMLQRSPSYVFSLPARNSVVGALGKLLPRSLAARAARWERILFQYFSYFMARLLPKNTRQYLIRRTRKQLTKGFDVEKHFSPNYSPWEQRLCVAPDGDFFKVLSKGTATIVTDEIKRFNPRGIKLRSGAEIDADVIVTATGLAVQPLGRVLLRVDGGIVLPQKHFSYKGVMLSDVPNFVSTFGYVNASWTLRADLVARYVCRLINYMDKKQVGVVTPKAPDDLAPEAALSQFSSGYLTRAAHKMPPQGSRPPWRQPQNYLLEQFTLGLEPIKNRALHFHPATDRT